MSELDGMRLIEHEDGHWCPNCRRWVEVRGAIEGPFAECKTCGEQAEHMAIIPLADYPGGVDRITELESTLTLWLNCAPAYVREIVVGPNGKTLGELTRDRFGGQ